jgi:hypothetical protein
MITIQGADLEPGSRGRARFMARAKAQARFSREMLLCPQPVRAEHFQPACRGAVRLP